MLKINWRCIGLTEFDNFMKALADEKEGPKELNLKLKKKIRAKYPDANIVAVDYDPGASEANQTNRLKLMMTVAKDNLKNITRFLY